MNDKIQTPLQQKKEVQKLSHMMCLWRTIKMLAPIRTKFLACETRNMENVSIFLEFLRKKSKFLC